MAAVVRESDCRIFFDGGSGPHWVLPESYPSRTVPKGAPLTDIVSKQALFEASEMPEPSTTGTNGRFQPGNKAAVGHQTRSMKLRAAMLAAVTEKDMRAITKHLVKLAKGGDLKAIELLLNRTIGKLQASPVDEPDEQQIGRNRILEMLDMARGVRDAREPNAETCQ